MKTFRWILITVLTLSLIGFPTTTAQAASASMTLTSSMPNPVLVGGEIAFDLAFSVAGIEPGVSGAEIYLGYNPALVTPPTTPGTAAAEVLPDFFGVSNFSINEVLPASQCPGGTNPCVHLVLAGPPQTSQTGIAARFHFRTLAIGSACFSMLSSKMVDANGYDVVHTTAPDLCRPIQGRTTTGLINRQGVVAIPNPGNGSLACSSVNATGTWPYGPVNTDKNGNFSMPNLPNGTYTFRVTYPGYLPAEKANVAMPNNLLEVNVGTVTLRGGDVNGDNAINILDIGSIISKFGRTGVAVRSASTNCGSDEPADINDDGLINISDLAITAGNWGSTGSTVWP